MKSEPDALVNDPRLWRAGAAAPAPKTVPVGDAELRALLPGGGWPSGALTELLVPTPGSGEISLLLPELVAVSAAGRGVAWIGASYPPYAPALVAAGLDVSRLLCVQAEGVAGVVWAAEQSLQSGGCGAVLIWLGSAPMRQLRRLQLAAVHGDTLAVLCRPATVARQPSPAVLRVLLEPADEGVRLHVLKCRGRRPGSRWVRVRPPTR